jgi:glycosyltransferase involved in cell wall biosynthesis
MPSRFETFGLVAVEAQASGVPVVAFDVGPLAEVTGRCGAALVPAFDVRAFADATREVLRIPPSDEQRTTAREWARQYDWNKIALRQEAWYLARVAAPRPR